MKIFGLLIIFLSTLTFAQISLIGSGTYTQDFNTLSNSGTSSTVPTGWALSESGTNANTTYTAGTGSSTTGDTYSFGAAANTDRAFGGLLSGNLTPIIGASFTNNTGFIITQIPISYTGEQWRLGALARVDRLDFQYSLDATSLTTGIWVDVNQLDFTAPTTAGTVGALDGNASANKTLISFTIIGLSITNGSTIWIRWTDFNSTGSDDGLAIDEFSIDQTNLPVELSSFSASVIGSSVKLNWVTATEVNNYGFEILRQAHTSTSLSVTSWEKIGFINGNGNSNSPKNYSFVDKDVTAGKYSYKLKQIDNDGQFEYSKAIEVDLGAPKKLELSQNYPNPFNPATTIRFNLPEATNVKLTLYNILGQEIKTLVNEFKESGVHTINFNASELNSELYIYKLEAGSQVQTKKMTLIK